MAITQPPVVLVENHEILVFFSYQVIRLIIKTESDYKCLYESAR